MLSPNNIFQAYEINNVTFVTFVVCNIVTFPIDVLLPTHTYTVLNDPPHFIFLLHLFDLFAQFCAHRLYFKFSLLFESYDTNFLPIFLTPPYPTFSAEWSAEKQFESGE